MITTTPSLFTHFHCSFISIILWKSVYLLGVWCAAGVYLIADEKGLSNQNTLLDVGPIKV